MKENMKKLTLLLMALPCSSMVSLLSSSMNYIHAEYAQYSEAFVTMILTLPSLTVLLGLILAPITVKKVPVKTLIILGLAVFTFSNVALVWVKNFYLVLLLRALAGIGCGLIFPLQMTLIATYPEKQRANLMGFTVTMGCLITIVLVAISGVVAEFYWRYVFLLYSVNVVTIILSMIFIPKHIEADNTTSVQHNTTTDKTTAKISDYKNIIFIYIFFMVGCYTFTNILGAEIAPYLDNVQMGGAKESGIMMSMSLIGATISGMVLGKYLELLKSFAMTCVYVGTAIAFALMWLAPSLVFVGIACFVIGFFGAIVTALVNYELSLALPISLFTTVSAAVNFAMFVLQFLAPNIFIAILAFVPSGSFRTVCMIYAIIETVMIGISLVLPKILLKNEQKNALL